MLDLIEPINVNGRSGFSILLNTWCENAETFQGYWPSRISTLALTQLLLSERPSIRNLIVKGDMILKAETKNGEFVFLGLSGGCFWFSRGIQSIHLCRSLAPAPYPHVNDPPVIMTRSRTKTSKDHPSFHLPVYFVSQHLPPFSFVLAAAACSVLLACA